MTARFSDRGSEIPAEKVRGGLFFLHAVAVRDRVTEHDHVRTFPRLGIASAVAVGVTVPVVAHPVTVAVEVRLQDLDPEFR